MSEEICDKEEYTDVLVYVNETKGNNRFKCLMTKSLQLLLQQG